MGYNNLGKALEIKDKILFVVAGLSRGGGEGQFVNLVNNIDKSKYDCTVIVFTHRDKIQYSLDSSVNVIALDRTRHFSLLAALTVYIDLAKEIRRLRPKAIITFLNLANQFVRLTKPFHGCRPVIITSMRMNFCFYPAKWKTFEKITSRLSTYVVHNSYRSAEYSKDILKPKKGNITIPNSCDLTAVLACETPIEKEYDFICVGRLIDIKNHVTLLNATKILSETYPNAKMLIVGSGELEDTLKAQASILKLDDNIEFMPKTDRIFYYYGLSRYSVLISHHEGFPNVIIESLSKGLPCLISDQANGSEVVKDGFNGYICDADSVENVAEGMMRLLQLSEDGYKKLSTNASDDVKANYSIESMTSKYIELIESGEA